MIRKYSLFIRIPSMYMLCLLLSRLIFHYKISHIALYGCGLPLCDVCGVKRISNFKASR